MKLILVANLHVIITTWAYNSLNKKTNTTVLRSNLGAPPTRQGKFWVNSCVNTLLRWSTFLWNLTQLRRTLLICIKNSALIKGFKKKKKKKQGPCSVDLSTSFLNFKRWWDQQSNVKHKTQTVFFFFLVLSFVHLNF